MSTDNYNADGPIIVWHDYGSEGYQPMSYPTIEAALEAGLPYRPVITQRLPLAVVVREPKAPEPVEFGPIVSDHESRRR